MLDFIKKKYWFLILTFFKVFCLSFLVLTFSNLIQKIYVIDLVPRDTMILGLSFNLKFFQWFYIFLIFLFLLNLCLTYIFHITEDFKLSSLEIKNFLFRLKFFILLFSNISFAFTVGVGIFCFLKNIFYYNGFVLMKTPFFFITKAFNLANVASFISERVVTLGLNHFFEMVPNEKVNLIVNKVMDTKIVDEKLDSILKNEYFMEKQNLELRLAALEHNAKIASNGNISTTTVAHIFNWDNIILGIGVAFCIVCVATTSYFIYKNWHTGHLKDSIAETDKNLEKSLDISKNLNTTVQGVHIENLSTTDLVVNRLAPRIDGNSLEINKIRVILENLNSTVKTLEGNNLNLHNTVTALVLKHNGTVENLNTTISTINIILKKLNDNETLWTFVLAHLIENGALFNQDFLNSLDMFSSQQKTFLMQLNQNSLEEVQNHIN